MWKYCIVSHSSKMWWLCVLLMTYVTVVHGRRNEEPRVITRYFDSIIDVAITQYRGITLSDAILNIKDQLREIYSACDETIGRALEREFTANTVYPGLCGTIGYTSPLPVKRTWTIELLAYPFGIKLHILHLNLPYLGLFCQFSNVSISSLEHLLCGNMSGTVVHSRYEKMIVTLNQGYELMADSGFVATYSALERSMTSFQTGSDVFLVRERYTMRYSFAVYELSHVQGSAYSWHIIAPHYKRIHFQGNSQQGIQVHDGPWHLSPILHGNHTSGNCAYIVQVDRFPLLQYITETHTTFETSSSIRVQSSPVSNTVKVYQVPGGGQSLEVQSLQIQYTGAIGHMVERCQYGGLFVYALAPTRGGRMQYSKKIDFCITYSRNPYTIQLSDDETQAAFYVYVIMYAGYCQGQVQALIKPKKCTIVKSFLDLQCNFHYHHLWPDMDYTFSINPSGGSIGPINMQVQLVNLVYSTELVGLTVESTDQNIFGKERKTRVDDVRSFLQYDLDNPLSVTIRYKPGRLFVSLCLILLEIQNKAFAGEQSGVYNLSHVAFFVNKEDSSITITGSTTYRIDGLTVIPAYTLFSIHYTDSFCQRMCSSIALNLTQYVVSRDIHVSSYQTAIPVYGTNAMSRGSFTVLLSLSETCKNCHLLISASIVRIINDFHEYHTDEPNLDLEFIEPGRYVTQSHNFTAIASLCIIFWNTMHTRNTVYGAGLHSGSIP